MLLYVRDFYAHKTYPARAFRARVLVPFLAIAVHDAIDVAALQTFALLHRVQTFLSRHQFVAEFLHDARQPRDGGFERFELVASRTGCRRKTNMSGRGIESEASECFVRRRDQVQGCHLPTSAYGHCSR